MKCFRSFFGTRALLQCGQRSFMEENRLSPGENLASHTLERIWPLDPEVWHGCVTARAGAVLRDIAFRAAPDGADLLAIAFFVVRDKFFISPVLPEVSDQRKLVDLELLVFGGMGIIKSPLLERDVSADEHDQPAVLLVKVLNKLK